MKMNKLIAAALVSMIALSSCAEPGQQGGLNKQDLGTLLGAAGGAAIGSNIGKGKGQIVGIAAGTLLGAALGNQFGASLDRADMNYYNQTSQGALETNRTGQASTWRNPDSGHSGSFTPTKTYQEAGNYCREYTQKITVGGKTEEGFGKACRQPDGSWRIIE